MTAVDPSVSMLEKGIQPGDPSLPRVEYKQGDAQNLGFLRDGEVDLVVAGKSECLRSYLASARDPCVWSLRESLKSQVCARPR